MNVIPHIQHLLMVIFCMVLPKDELELARNEAHIGKVTRASIRRFFKENSLKPPENQQEDSWEWLQWLIRELEAAKKPDYFVWGTITDPDGNAIPNATVQAFDADLPSLNADQLLGTTMTDRDGQYAICFDRESFRRGERIEVYERNGVRYSDQLGPDLYIKIQDMGVVLGKSDTQFNAEAETQIDLAVDRSADSGLSEYERLLQVIVPIIETVAPADLTWEDIEFLSREISFRGSDNSIPKQYLKLLRVSALVARQTGVATEAFYGWGRIDPQIPADWWKLREMPEGNPLREFVDTLLTQLIEATDETLRAGLVSAVEQEFIPLAISDRIDEIIRKLKKSRLITKRAVGRLINAETGVPLTGLTVRLFDPAGANQSVEVGNDVTNTQGLFALYYFVASTAQEDEEIVLSLKVLENRANVLLETEVRVKVDQKAIIDIPVTIPVAQELPEHQLTELAAAIPLEIPPELTTYLADNNIHSLGDIRRAGGISRLEGLPVASDHPAIALLEAHADLSRLSSDVKINASLIDKQYASVTTIAHTPRTNFVSDMAESVGEFRAAKLQVAARAQTQFINSVLMGEAANHANDLQVEGLVKPEDGLMPEQCGCKDCEAAVSPLAYLADLLKYVMEHVKDGVSPVSVATLNATFHQPFTLLTASCDATDNQVRQVRLVVEVLRDYLISHQPTATQQDVLNNAEHRYRVAAYTSLLVRHGTSYDELRLAEGGGEAFRNTLSERLGINQSHLSDFFIDVKSAAFSEAELEKRFGLLDSNRNPLLIAPPSLLQTWRLENLRTLWKKQDWPEIPATENAPLIDPDLISPSDLVNPVTGNPAFDILQARENDVSAQLVVIHSAAQTLAGFDENVVVTLGSPLASFLEIETLRAAGRSTIKALELLSLKTEEYAYLLRIRSLLDKGQPILDAEWESVYSILIQVWKRKNFANWRNTERNKELLLSPDFFQIPPPAKPTFPVPKPTPMEIWRAPREARQAWKDRLQTRIDQQQSVIQALLETASTVEETTLPMLRDALILASDADGNDLDSKAEWITKNLLIDAKMDGCAMTTRVAQAIETVQGLLLSLRSEQVANAFPTLRLVTDHFNEEWKWMGSYATWRAAMFVFLYPENILQPSLRSWQTSAFKNLVRSTQAPGGVSPNGACSAASEYSNYLQDISTLRVEASCTSRTRLYRGDTCSKVENGYRCLFYIFGRGGSSGRVYWSAYDDTSTYQTPWEALEIENFDNIVEIFGAAPYQVAPGERYIFLFGRQRHNSKIACVKYDLENRTWRDEAIFLETPSSVPEFSAVVKQQDSELTPPHIAVCAMVVGECKLKPNGSEWENRRFGNLTGAIDVVGMVAVGDNAFYLLFKAGKNELRIALFVSSELQRLGMTLDITSQYKGVSYYSFGRVNYLGSFSWLGTNDVFVLTQPVREDSKSKIVGGVPILNFGGATLWRVSDAGIETLYVSQVKSPFGMFSEPRLSPTSGVVDDPSTKTKRFVYQSADDIAYEDSFAFSTIYGFSPLSPRPVMPSLTGPFNIPSRLSYQDLQIRKQLLQQAYKSNRDGPSSNLSYIEEAYFFVPMQLAIALQRSGELMAALEWLITIYDYRVAENERKIYPGLIAEESFSEVYKRAQNWLFDPLNPHAIATTRRNTYTRFTLLTIIRCLIDYADIEFTRDTAETNPRARQLYSLALELLDSDALKQHAMEKQSCEDIIGTLNDLAPLINGRWGGNLRALQADLKPITNLVILRQAVTQIQQVFANGDTPEHQFAEAKLWLIDALSSSPPPTLIAMLVDETHRYARANQAIQTQEVVVDVMSKVGAASAESFQRTIAMVSGISEIRLERGRDELTWLREPIALKPKGGIATGERAAVSRIDAGRLNLLAPTHIANLAAAAAMQPMAAVNIAMEERWIRTPSWVMAFCVPANPMLKTLRLRAEVNLRKLRTCRNIAGVRRDLEAYAAATDAESGLPTIGAAGQISLPGTNTFRPTLYRYAVLVERAKQIVGIAAQIEVAMLSAIEKRNNAAHALLTTRQQLGLVQAGTRLQTLRLAEANHGMKLANLQKERARKQLTTYQEWLSNDTNKYEKALLANYETIVDLQVEQIESNLNVTYAQIALSLAGASIAGAVAAASSAVVAGYNAYQTSETAKKLARAQKSSQENSFQASFERKKDEWNLQAAIAAQDISIGDQQIELANDHVEIVQQEKVVSELQASQAKDTIVFLTNRFDNVELYDWMSDILEQVYRFFLQQATAMAKLALNQLGFERQETPPSFIQDDYWAGPANSSTGKDATVDRKGLTGSTRLLQDIYQLDQYAFETKKRKLELTKTISLAQLAPAEFQQFRETGVMVFATPMELFDRDFPGHYLRLIRRVRTSVIALIPPTHGIHATLSTAGLTRTVIGSEIFQMVSIRRDPEFVALTSPMGSTGSFELEPQQADMLLPFEGNGVDSIWEFRMPKAANQFDYQSIADVLITIEYTALNSFDYREQVIQSLKPNLSSERAFSFRQQFADQWYDLHNPEQTKEPMIVRFKTLREDFPPNLENLRIQQVLLYFSRATGKSFEVTVNHLLFPVGEILDMVGGGATSIDGVISTRHGTVSNASSWIPMIGKEPYGEWELDLNTDELKDRFKNEEIEDMLLVITYSGRSPEWSS